MSSDHPGALEVAADLFERHGYDGVTMTDVARAAGVARRTVYERYGSKAGLLASIADHCCRELAMTLLRRSGGGAESNMIPKR